MEPRNPQPISPAVIGGKERGAAASAGSSRRLTLGAARLPCMHLRSAEEPGAGLKAAQEGDKWIAPAPYCRADRIQPPLL